MTRAGLSRLLFVAAKAVLLAVGLSFMYLGLVKLDNFPLFHEAVRSHGLIPERGAGVLAGVAIGLELAFGALAVWGALGGARRCAFSAAGITLLCLALTGYSAIMWLDPPPEPVSCGCSMSGAVVESWAPLMARNAALTSAASLLTLALLRGQRGSTDDRGRSDHGRNGRLGSGPGRPRRA